MSEFGKVKIKCEDNSSEAEEKMESKSLQNFSGHDYKLTKREEVFYTYKFNDYSENSNPFNFVECLDTKVVIKTMEENESDYGNNSQPSTSNDRTSRFRTVKEWNPTTRLGRMVKNRKYKSIKELRRNNLVILERSVVNFLLGPALSFDVLYVKPTFDLAGEFRGYASFACAGDRNGHFGYSIKYDPVRDNSVHGSIERAIINVNPIKRLSYKIDNKKLYTVASEVTGFSGGVVIRLLPECSNAGISISNYYVRSMLRLAGIDNCKVEVKGCDHFIGNIALATYRALMELYDIE